MNDQLPDFEAPAPMFEDPKPKKARRKPNKRKAAKVEVRVAPKRAVKKRRTVKRGRPPGALNKPKQIVRVDMNQMDIAGRVSPSRFDVVAFIQNVLVTAVQPWQAAILRKMVREA